MLKIKQERTIKSWIITTLLVACQLAVGSCSNDSNKGDKAQQTDDDTDLFLNNPCNLKRKEILAKDNVDSLDDLIQLVRDNPSEYWLKLTCDDSN